MRFIDVAKKREKIQVKLFLDLELISKDKTLPLTVYDWYFVN